MKITGIRMKEYHFQLDRKMGDANFPEGKIDQSGMVLYIDTDEDISGIAVGEPSSKTSVESLEPFLIGKDPRGVKGLWKRLIDAIFKGGNEGLMNSAVGLIDIAMWDLKSKINNEPLWKTLGGSSRYVRSYASGIDLPLSDEEIYDFYEGAALKGISAGKLKVGLDIEADIRRIGIMEQALKKSGKPVQLLIDSNEYWSPKQAIRHIRLIEEQFEIFWAEEPARRWDYRGLKRVSKSITAAVATGENLSDIKDFMPLIEQEAVDIVQVGIRTGGITGLMKVADMAYGFEIPVSVMNSPVNYMAPAASAIPNHIMLEIFHDRDAGILSTDSKIEDGYIVLGNTPGSGLQIDERSLNMSEPNRSRKWSGLASGRRRGAGLIPVSPGEPIDLDE